jgi:hypothetical protein
MAKDTTGNHSGDVLEIAHVLSLRAGLADCERCGTKGLPAWSMTRIVCGDMHKRICLDCLRAFATWFERDPALFDGMAHVMSKPNNENGGYRVS